MKPAEFGIQFQERYRSGSILKSSLQPANGAIIIAKSGINQRDSIRGYIRLADAAFQIMKYLAGLVRVSGNCVDVAECALVARVLWR